MYLSRIEIENFRCFASGASGFSLDLKPGLTALVGENDSGKTAVIDALRFALGTTDQEWYRLDDSDFHEGAGSSEIRILCKFEGLSSRDKRAFLEFLSYPQERLAEPLLYVNWTAKNSKEILKGRVYRRVEVHSGKNGDGPSFDPEVRELLRVTYLRPLRDAEQALSAGKGSRLAQVLHNTKMILGTGIPYDPEKLLKDQELSVLEIGRLINDLLEKQKGVSNARDGIDSRLSGLTLRGDDIKSLIKVSGAMASDDALLRQLLEKLDLKLNGAGRLGLGSENILFMACELLLLAQENQGNKLLLIEEPEAHLHAQRQLRVVQHMQEQSKEKDIQIIVSTHSPNLASAIYLENMVMIHGKKAYSMANDLTNLETSDYRFLQRFLDVTKANLFFARGVMIVEGDAENILLPTLARLIGLDFSEHGVSIVNVGGVGLRRYARIFQRKSENKKDYLRIPVACVTDMDVMPNCAPYIINKLKAGDDWPDINSNRRWRANRDFCGENSLEAERNRKEDKASGQCVKTFVSDHWTLEYDLAFSGLAEYVYLAARLALEDDAINTAKTTISAVRQQAVAEFSELDNSSSEEHGCSAKEVRSSKVYAKFAKDGASKAIAAQYLSECLQRVQEKQNFSAEDWRKRLPKYLVDAIEYVTSMTNTEDRASSEVKTDGE